MSSLIRPLHALTAIEHTLAGGKASSLGVMKQAGIRVPDGFVILNKAFDVFMDENAITIDTLLNQTDLDISSVSEQIQNRIMAGTFSDAFVSAVFSSYAQLQSPLVAVRSSGTKEDGVAASWAGQFYTKLGADKESLLLEIKKCWASVYSVRALTYHMEKDVTGIHNGMAVIVQEMIPAQSAGVYFSLHPQLPESQYAYIEACFGLGESLVSGTVVPASYTVFKETHSVLDETPHAQTQMLHCSKDGLIFSDIAGTPVVLTHEQVSLLSQTAQKIESLYGHPCDIEWAFVDSSLYILQSRPITIPVSHKEITPDQYVRAFSFNNINYLISGSGMSWYKQSDFLAIFENNKWTSYFHKTAILEYAENGKKLFSSARNFAEFERGFRRAILKTQNYLAEVKKINEVQVNDIYELLALIREMYYFFEKTEFFFTDSSYLGEMSETTRKNLLILGEDLKMVSRPLIVEILTSVPYHFVSILSSAYSVPDADLRCYSYEELIRLIELGSYVDDALITKRQQSFVVLGRDSTTVDITGLEEQNILNAFREDDLSSLTTFSGKTANKGCIRGKVIVVLPEFDMLYEDFVKKIEDMTMTEGEILVTETSSPDFMPLIHKAGGIIANQGGLNSHAAIVSREFDIPCLVGTHNATEILKTGDYVELNADKGYVKIVRRE